MILAADHIKARRRWADLMSILAVTFALCLPASVYVILTTKVDNNAKQAFVDQCHNGNKHSKASLDFITGNLDRAEKAYKATLASSGATPVQRTNATVALGELPQVRSDAVTKFAPDDCTYPTKSSQD